jgi:hypothetical protein
MTAQKQTRLSDPEHPKKGNCFTACLASILDMPIEQVPNFIDFGQDWFEPFYKFLREHGFEYHGLRHGTDALTYEPGIDGYYIVGGKSHREFAMSGHAVVFRHGKMIFDPHPSNDGLLSIEEAYMIERS